MIEILKELCRIPTAFGMENGILEHIEKNYAQGLESFRDGMGNLTVLKKCGKKDAPVIMLYASADACGFIVNYIEENGFLRVTRLGGASAVSSAFTELVSEKGVHGFILPEKGAEVKDGDASKLYIDIGAESKKEAEERVMLGDVFAPVRSCSELCGGRIGGNGAASAVPLAILLKLMRDSGFSDTDVYFSFGVQDKLGGRGAKTAAFDIAPELCICLGICESMDTAGAVKRGEAVLGDGAVILAKSSGYSMLPKLREEAEKLALSVGARHKVCVYNESTVAASVIGSCGSGVACVQLCIPARNTGSGAEVCDISDARELEKLVSAFIK